MSVDNSLESKFAVKIKKFPSVEESDSVNMNGFTEAIIIFVLLYQTVNSFPCALRDYPSGSVCVCNASYCDTLDDVHPKGPGEFILVSSSKGGLRFSVTTGKFIQDSDKVVREDYDMTTGISPNVEPSVILRDKRFSNDFIESFFKASNSRVDIIINRNTTFQKIVGFGGAFTGSVSENLGKVTDELKNNIFRSYFSKSDGIGYTFIRLSIGGCDFDLQPWAYNEFPKNDAVLSNFTKLDARDEKKIDQLRDLMKVSDNYDIKFFGSAWSPPPWMKNNNAWTGFSKLRDEYYQTWADYHLKFVELMAAKNISIWAISTGNEPLNGVIGWLFVRFMSLGWTPKNQGRWVGENLGPTMRKSNFKNVKLFGNDDQRYTFPSWFQKMEQSQVDSTKFLDGLAVHWYWDGIFGPSLLDKAHELYEDKLIINTESCVGDKPWETHGPELGSWERAEKYIGAYIEDLQHWVNGWIDWNLILDETGGPNYVRNFVDAPIIVNVTSGMEFYKQPMFYAIGHFSKFIPEGSVRIGSLVSDIDVKSVSFMRPDECIATIIFNRKNTAIDVAIHDSINGNIVMNIPPRSVHTLVYK